MSGVVTLAVPAEYVPALREGAAHELQREGAQAVRDHRCAADLLTTTRHLREMIDIEEQLAAREDPRADTEVQADAEALAQTLETTARDVLGPQVTTELGVEIGDESSSAPLVARIDSLRWAVAQAAEMYGRAQQLRATPQRAA